jgi:hypothetical protein
MAGQSEGGGCSRVFGYFVLLVLLGIALDKLGCVATDDSLRRGTSITVTEKEVLADKNLFVVHYKVHNATNWPVGLRIEWTVALTTGEGQVTNIVKLSRVPSHGVTEQRVMFDTNHLKTVGLDDPLDPDRCSVIYKIVAVKENE